MDVRRLSDRAQSWVAVDDNHVMQTSGSSSAFSTVNSSATPLAANGVFTGTSEDITTAAEIRVTIFSDVASAVDGLQIQQSKDGVNWDNSDTFTIPAGVGKTFGFGAVQQFMRVVYTNGASPQTAFRLSTKVQVNRTKPSSVRAQDGRTNDNDFEEVVAYGALFNGTSWDRARGTATGGAFMQGPAARSAAAVGNPVLCGGKVSTSIDLTLVDGDAVDFAVSTNGATITKPYAAPELDWTYAAASGGIVNTADNTLVAAAGAGIRNYLTGISIQNASATIATEVVIKDGSTIIWRGYLGIGSLLNSAVGLAFPTPLRSSANTALVVAAITTASTIYVNAQGYKAP